MSIFSGLFEKRATKTTDLDPRKAEYWIGKLFGYSQESASGVDVDESTVLNYAAYWAAVNIISGAIGTLPAKVYRKLSDGNREQVTGVPASRLISQRPNKFMDPLTFKETLTAHVLTWGNGYAEIERNTLRRPVALWPLTPNRVAPRLVGGEMVYDVTLPNNKVQTLAYDQVLHIKGLGYNGMVGYSIARKASESVGLGIATERFGGKFFSNGARPGGVLQHPGKLGDLAEKHLRESWDSLHKGIENSQRIAILEEGMEFKSIGIPGKDAQMLETRDYQVQEIARWFQMPPHMLADLSHATFSNIEHQGIEFVTQTLMRWLVTWEQELSYKLLAPAERDSMYVEFSTAALLRGDTKSRFEAYNLGITGGWLSRNEARRRENMNSAEGLDVFLAPLNYAPVAADGTIEGDDTDDNTD